jgi:hypothetical protein
MSALASRKWIFLSNNVFQQPALPPSAATFITDGDPGKH